MILFGRFSSRIYWHYLCFISLYLFWNYEETFIKYKSFNHWLIGLYLFKRSINNKTLNSLQPKVNIKILSKTLNQFCFSASNMASDNENKLSGWYVVYLFILIQLNYQEDAGRMELERPLLFQREGKFDQEKFWISRRWKASL